MVATSIRQRVILASCGVIIGIMVFLALYTAYKVLFIPRSYRNLSELRQEMLGHDSRDVKADQSVSLRSIIQPNSSDEIIYELRPNLTTKFQGVPVRTNKWGMRGPDIELNKDPNVIRVALLGDSFAFGWGVNEEESFARIFEKYSNEHVKGDKRVEVLNFGVPGYSTFQEVAAFLQSGSKFKPDIVIVYFVDNDFGLPFFIDSQESEGGLVSAISFAKRAWSGENEATTQRHNELKGLIDANKALLKLDDTLSSQGVKLYVLLNPGGNATGTLNKLWAVRKKRSIHLVDIRNSLSAEIQKRGLKPQQLVLQADPHPSVIKHEMIGRYMAESFRDDITKLIH